jgi:hypothetical protein
MSKIQTFLINDRGEREELSVNDARYWNGPDRGYEPYPKAMYRQTQPGQECEVRVVKSDSEMNRLGSDWFESPADAAVHFEQLEADMARADAERRAKDVTMSTLALAEALKAERATDQMLGEIPEKPKRKYVRKVKPSVS